MLLKHIKFSGLRNLHSASIQLSPRFNLFFGKNGSGKTSFLEAIHLLATGRSFRCNSTAEFITFNAKSCIVTGESRREEPNEDCFNEGCINEGCIQDSAQYSNHSLHLGIERLKEGGLTLKVGQDKCSSLAQFAQVLPLQMINTNTYQLLEGGSIVRRQFIDWGMFHVEHSFYPVWQKYQRALKQRNAALKRFKIEGVSSVLAWNKELCESGEQLSVFRAQLIQKFTPIFQQVLRELGYCEKLQLVFKRGWSEQMSLEEALQAGLEQDLARGFTQYGAHRGDLIFNLVDKGADSAFSRDADTVFSRGQQKLLISALMIARGRWFYEQTGRRSLFLIDDLGSELDLESSEWLLHKLQELAGQVVVTMIDHSFVKSFLEKREIEYKMFHVEHGLIQPWD